MNERTSARYEAKTDTPRVSVILPVYNDAERLKRCLDALADQSYPREQYEVLVVDNRSSPPLDEVVEPFGQARCLHESKRGSYAARNTGLAAARGSILAFTDSDCIPSADWIAAGVRCLSELPEGERLIGGHIELVPGDPAHPTGAELYDLVFGLSQKTYVEREHFAATANVFVTREIMDAVGSFDAELQSGGDNEWGKRAFAGGYPLSYAEDVVVRHPTRASFREMFTKIRRVTLGNCDLSRKDRGWRRRCWIRLAKILPSLRYSVWPALTAGSLTPWMRVRLLGVIVVAHYYEYGIRLGRIGDLLRPLEESA